MISTLYGQALDMAENKHLAFTVNEFCESHGISRSLFYEIRKKNKGPAIMKVSGRTLISAESAAVWRRRMEQADHNLEVAKG